MGRTGSGVSSVCSVNSRAEQSSAGIEINLVVVSLYILNSLSSKGALIKKLGRPVSRGDGLCCGLFKGK